MSDEMMLWLDLETTGSDPSTEAIIEVGAILTTTDLDEIASYECFVRPPDDALGRMVRNGVVREMHRKNGLLEIILEDEICAAPEVVARSILDWLRANGAPEGKTILAGSGVGHFDKRFLDKWMPQVSRYLRYWVIDVGVIRRAHRFWAGSDLTTLNERKPHRAVEDARLHLDEARAFRDLWQAQAHS